MGCSFCNIDIGPASWRRHALDVTDQAWNVERRFRVPLVAGDQVNDPCAEAMPEINGSQMRRYHHHNATAWAKHTPDLECGRAILDERSRKGRNDGIGAGGPQGKQPCVGANEPRSLRSDPLLCLPDHGHRAIHGDPVNSFTSGDCGQPSSAAAKLNNGCARGNEHQGKALPAIPLTGEHGGGEGVIDCGSPAVERLKAGAQQGSTEHLRTAADSIS